MAKILVLEGQYGEAGRGKVLRAVQNGLLSILGIPAGDLFRTIHILPRSQYLHTLSLPSLKYAEDLILSDVIFIPCRPTRSDWNY